MNPDLASWWLLRTVSTCSPTLEQLYQSGLAFYGRFVVGSVTRTQARIDAGSHCYESEDK